MTWEKQAANIEQQPFRIDVTFDQNGDLDRESFIVKVVNGKQQVIATVPRSAPRTKARSNQRAFLASLNFGIGAISIAKVRSRPR